MSTQPSELTSSDTNDPVAARLRGFGPLGILAILLILAGNFLFAPLARPRHELTDHQRQVLQQLREAQLAVEEATGLREDLAHQAALLCTPWREVGYIRPQSWPATISIGIIFGIAFKLVMKALVMPLLGGPEINPAYHYLAGNTAALPGMIYTMIVVAGFGEETVFRGWMFERFGKLFGTSVRARTIIVLLTSVLFSVAHYPGQGLAGAEQALITGLVFGTIFAVTGRIFMVMIAHAAFDLLALAIIYWNLEVEVAHLIFK